MSTYSKNYFGSSPGLPGLRDFQHAARLFTDGDQQLAPKTKFLYHVSFSINTQALQGLNFKYRHQNRINMLVKTAELPKFNIQTETLNQYNRKKNVQIKLDYQPITIKFHDDNLGVTRQLWENYFGYYYGDSEAAKISGAYNRNAMQGPSFIRGRYGLDNTSSSPFFNDITLYQMAKRTWNSYKLINPIIQSWSHDSLDYSSSQPSEQTMTLIYESVAYDNGVVDQGNPPGFALEHYDQTPSPIALLGGGASTGGSVSFGGARGILAGVESVFGAIGSGRAFNSVGDFINTATTAVNTYQNARALGSSQARQQLGGLILDGARELSKVGLSGIKDVNFGTKNTTAITESSLRNILNN